MQTGRIEVHTHLLPAVDDGCETYAQSLQCAESLAGAGYTHVFCTPHLWPSLPRNKPRQIADWVAEFQLRLDAAAINLQALPGGEINLADLWPRMEEWPAEEIATFGNAGKYALFDFWSDDPTIVATRIEPAVQHLLSLGITPILAHPERIGATNKHPAVLDRLTDLGVMLQLNAWCLAHPPSSAAQTTALRLLHEGRYFLIGADLHRPDGFEGHVEGLAEAAKIVGEAELAKLCVENPRLLLPPTA